MLCRTALRATSLAMLACWGIVEGAAAAPGAGLGSRLNKSPWSSSALRLRVSEGAAAAVLDATLMLNSACRLGWMAR